MGEARDFHSETGTCEVCGGRDGGGVSSEGSRFGVGGEVDEVERLQPEVALMEVDFLQ